MEEINLSQSLQEREAAAHGSFFDRGFLIILTVLIGVLLLYGGVYWYNWFLNQEIVQTQQQIDEKQAQLRGRDVDRVADLRDRLDMIKMNLESQPDPTSLFSRLENTTVPTVRLTEYKEQWLENKVELSGVTDNFKYLAQEMLTLKKNNQFQKIAVKSVAFNDDGQLEFTLVIDTLTGASQSVTP